MKEFMRSLFGLEPSSGTRKVVGKSVPVDVKHVAYVAESAERLQRLYQLSRRYYGSPHEQKIKTVYEKSRKIHDYLVSRNRVHELELFHLQHTDHFISTYSVILDVHQQHVPASFTPAAPQEEVSLNTFIQEKLKKLDRSAPAMEMVRPASSQPPLVQKVEYNTEIPRLSVPEISINTFAKVRYRSGGSAEGAALSEEIGFTSTPLEKEAFLRYVAGRLGMSNISYAGNAMVNIPNNNGGNPTGLVPIIHWEGFLYALNLNDFRLFPVKMLRKSH